MAELTIKYLGKAGEYLTSDEGTIPARNLTTEDYDALTTAQRATVRTTGLYDYASYKDAIATAKTSEPVADEPKTPPATEAVPPDPTAVAAAEAVPETPATI